jgi:lipoate---protein ligase
MKLLDLTLPTAAENLAGDEALLDWREAAGGDDLLRFWEPREPFVVVGYANRVAAEVNLEACAAQGVPIYRRCSGGGTVLQAPGSLNYALVLRLDNSGPLQTISGANQFIMERNRDALSTLWHTSRSEHQASTIHHPPSTIEILGHTDLALGNLKFSGNAQRRRRRFLLFHGTFLLQSNLELMESLLPLPSRQPEYRQNRRHGQFLVNLGLPADAVKRALQQAWNAFEPLEEVPRETIASLARDKYATPEWNQKF